MSSENRNLVLAALISCAILMAFHFFYEVPRQEQLKAIEAQEHSEQVAGARPDSPSAAVSTVPETGAARPRADILAETPRVSMENPRIYGSISRSGIRFDDLTFADYYTALDHKDHVDLLSPSGSESPYNASFGWMSDSKDLVLPGEKTEWRFQDKAGLTPDHPLSLSWDNGHGLLFRRSIAVDANYMFTITDTVENHGAQPVTLYPYAAVARQGTPTSGNSGLEGAVGMLGQKLESVGYKKLAEDKLEPEKQKVESTGGWLGFSDKYWLVVAIPDQSEKITAEFRHGKPDSVDFYQTDYRGQVKTIAPGASVTETARLFAGAKEVDLLTTYRDKLGIPKLELAVDWGRFRFLTKPFFYGIDYLAKLFHSFGLGILAFTVVINILVLPLRWKTFREMNRMGDLTPKMVAIKEKYGTDRAGMQVEVLELYKREKVNPLSGCLPVLLTLPVFFSLYTVLSTTIEMRQRPFFWYIQDLSAPDPTNIFNLFGLLPEVSFLPHLGFLPLVLGGTLVAMTLLGPKQADPLHQKMMLINPLIFTFMMAKLPAGLVIYYIWNNTLSMSLQKLYRLVYKAKYRKTPRDPEPDIPDLE